MCEKLNRAVSVLKTSGIGGLADSVIEHARWTCHNNAYINKMKRLYYVNYKYNKIVKNPFDLCYIDPNRIEFAAGSLLTSEKGSYHFELFDIDDSVYPGAVIGGSWDKQNYPFERLSEYRLLHQHFVEGLDWEDTDFFQKHMELSKFDSHEWDRNKLISKLARYDTIFKDIDTNGYKPQSEIGGPPLEEICVLMGRNKQLLWGANGRHRLSIAKILNVERVPVMVISYHEELLQPDDYCGGN